MTADRLQYVCGLCQTHIESKRLTAMGLRLHQTSDSIR